MLVTQLTHRTKVVTLEPSDSTSRSSMYHTRVYYNNRDIERLFRGSFREMHWYVVKQVRKHGPWGSKLGLGV